MVVLIFLIFLCLMVVGAILFLYLPMFCSIWRDAPFVPTGYRFIERILKFSKLKKGEVFYDLGSGEGRITRAAGRQGANALGIEKSIMLVLWSRLMWALTKDKNGKAMFKRINFYKHDLGDADVVYCYLLPEAMEKLDLKFKKELKKGCRIVSRAFLLPKDWEPVEVLNCGKRNPPLYLYIK